MKKLTILSLLFFLPVFLVFPRHAHAQGKPGSLIWKYSKNTGGKEIKSTAAVYRGNVYFMVENGRFFALDARTGKLKWKKDLGQARSFSLTSSPLAVNKHIYVGTLTGVLYCLDADTGAVTWKYQAGAKICSSPSYDGKNIYFGSHDHNLYCLDATSGEEVWKKDVGGRVISTPAYYKNNIFFGTEGKEIMSLVAKTGEKAWSVKVEKPVVASPAVAGDRMYITAENEVMYALDTTSGKKLGTFETEEKQNYHVASSPSISGELVIVGKEDFHLYGVSTRTVKKQWKSYLGGDVDCTPAIIGDTVFSGEWDKGKIYSIDRKSGKKNWTFQCSGHVIASPVIAGGRLYVGDESGNFYCLSTGLKSNQSWPMYMGNPARTGTQPQPEPIGKRGKKFWKLIFSGKSEPAEKILKNWPKKERGQRYQFYKSTLQITDHLKKNKFENVLVIWKKVTETGYLLRSDQENLFKYLKKKKQLKNWLQKKARLLKSRTYEKREAAFSVLKKAGPLAMPVIKELENSEDLETRLRAAKLYHNVTKYWPSFVTGNK